MNSFQKPNRTWNLHPVGVTQNAGARTISVRRGPARAGAVASERTPSILPQCCGRRTIRAPLRGRAALLTSGLLGALLFGSSLIGLRAQTSPTNTASQTAPIGSRRPPEAAATNAPSSAATPAASTNATAKSPLAEAATPPTVGTAATSTNQPAQADQDKGASSDEIQLSLQGANVDMVVQWLAQTTGKSVIKSPRVQCQVTITSTKKVAKREAINLVYRALALEGFTAVESADAILIVPEGQEPKLSPELIDTSQKGIPEGRQRLIKIFPLEHIQAAELQDKVRGVLSDKATIETDERGNRLIVTDYNDNLRLLADLIKEFDVASPSDATIEIYPLKYAEAEELGNLLGLILNAQAAPPGAPRRSSPTPSPFPSSGPRLPGGGPVMVGAPPTASSPPPEASHPSPSGGGAPASGQQVRIWPDKTANRLIVSAPKSKLPEIERLIKVLDTDKPADVTVRVIPLKNVAAADLAKEIGPLYQRMSGKSVKDTVDVSADDRSNSLIVFSSEANFKAIEGLVAELDTAEAQEKVMRTFPLKNADAEDVARQLQELNRDQDSSSRYPFYIFSSSPQGKTSKKMSVVADRRRNSLIVQAPPAQMDSIEKMVKELDEPVTDDSLAPKIFPLKYVSAVDIEDVLNELFLKKTQQRSYFFYDEYPPETPDRDVGRLYGKVRITSEPYANAIIVTSNSKESLAVVEDVLNQLDRPSEAGESTLRVGLKFAKASTVANSINILFAKNGSPPLRALNQQGQPGGQNPQQAQQQPQGASSQSGFELEQQSKEEGYYPWLGGQPDTTRTSDGRSPSRPTSDLVGRVRAVADERSNALLISANVHFFPQMLKLIEDLDAPTDQVVIEARLLEVSTLYLDQLGVRWSPNSSTFTANDYDNSFIASSSGQYTKGFGGTTANVPFNNTSSSSAAGSSLSTIITSLRSGVVNNSISMEFLVQFLREKTHATVLAEPQINIRDNETGRLFVGQKVPTPTGQLNPSLGGSSTTIVYQDVGVILEVTPHINEMGDVELKIHAESSSVVPGQTVLGGAVFDSRAFKTDLTAKNGQTLVLGGIIQKQVSDTLRKTPILGDIPGLGWAFKKRDKTSQEVELMVFLRPKVVRSPEDAKKLLDETYQKAPDIKEWNESNPSNCSGERPKKNSGR